MKPKADCKFSELLHTVSRETADAFKQNPQCLNHVLTEIEVDTAASLRTEVNI